MNLEIDELLSQPIEQVWRAVTDRATLALWLMESDFEPVVGRPFTMRCDGDVIEARVLALDAPHRMAWAWRHVGERKSGPTTVVFELRSEGAGTRLTLRHTGDPDEDLATRLGGGWPKKLAALRAAVDRRP